MITRSSNVPSRGQLILLAIILLAAGYLRFWKISAPSLWKDEFWSIEMAMGRGSLHDRLPPNIIHHDQIDLTNLSQADPSWHIVTHLGGVTHPPLYFLLLRWWIDLLGSSAAAVRSFSAIFSLAAVLVFFDLCRFLHGPRIALFAAAICALSTAQIEFAQEARAYPMLIFFGLCSVDQLTRIELLGPTRRRLIALAAFLVAAALTHYLFAGALIALAGYAALRFRGRARIQVLLSFFAAAVIILAIWVPLFINQKDTLPSLAPTFLREARIDEHAKFTLYRAIGLPIEYLLGESGGEAVPSAIVLAVFLFSLCLPLLRLFFRRDLILWILWSFGTIGFVAALDLAHQTTLLGYLRYTILASPAVYAIIAAFDWPRRNFIRDALAIATIGFLAVIAFQRNIDGVSPKEDWQTVAHSIDLSAGPDDLLVFYNNDPWTSPGIWYMGFKYYVPDSHRPWFILNAPATPDVLHQLQSYPRLWLIRPFPQRQTPPQILPGWFPAADEVHTTAGAFCLMLPIRAQ